MANEIHYRPVPLWYPTHIAWFKNCHSIKLQIPRNPPALGATIAPSPFAVTVTVAGAVVVGRLLLAAEEEVNAAALTPAAVVVVCVLDVDVVGVLLLLVEPATVTVFPGAV